MLYPLFGRGLKGALSLKLQSLDLFMGLLAAVFCVDNRVRDYFREVACLDEIEEVLQLSLDLFVLHLSWSFRADHPSRVH